MAGQNQTATLTIRINGENAVVTANALKQRMKDLNAELKKLKPGTDEFLKKEKEFRQIDNELFRMGKSMDGFKNATKGATATTESFISKAALIGTAIGGAVAGLVAFGFSSIKSYDQAEKVVTRLTVALNGNKEKVQELVKISQELQEVTLFSDDETQRGQARLALYTQEYDQLAALTPLIQDLATAKEIDLASAADAVGKALLGQGKSLKQLGIITEEGANSAERFKNIQLKLNQVVGGQAIAAGNAGAAAGVKLANAWDGVKEVFGKLLIPVFNAGVGLLNSLTKGIQNLIGSQDELIEQTQELASEAAIEFNLLKQNNLSNVERKGLIEQVNKKYKDYLPHLLTENSTLDEINEAQIKVNKGLQEKISLLIFEGKVQAIQKKGEDAYKRLNDLLLERGKLQKDIAAAEGSFFNLNFIREGDLPLIENQIKRAKSEYEGMGEAIKKAREEHDATNKFLGLASTAELEKAKNDRLNAGGGVLGIDEDAAEKRRQQLLALYRAEAEGRFKTLEEIFNSEKNNYKKRVDALIQYGNIKASLIAKERVLELAQEDLTSIQKKTIIIKSQNDLLQAERDFREKLRAIRNDDPLNQPLEGIPTIHEQYTQESLKTTETVKKDLEKREEDYRQFAQRALEISFELAAKNKELAEKEEADRKKKEENKAKEQAEALQKLRDAQYSYYGDLTGALSDFLGADEAARKQHSAAIKKLQIAQISLNLIGEISAIWKAAALAGPAGIPFAIVQSIAAGVRAAAAIGKVNSLSLYRGGYTGEGGEYDNSGHRVAGIVHDHEWVSPRWMTESPQYGPVIRQLEGVRKRGFAVGGYAGDVADTTPSASLPGLSAAANRIDTNSLRGAIESFTSAINNFPRSVRANVVYSDVEDAGNSLNEIKANSSL